MFTGYCKIPSGSKAYLGDMFGVHRPCWFIKKRVSSTILSDVFSNKRTQINHPQHNYIFRTTSAKHTYIYESPSLYTVQKLQNENFLEHEYGLQHWPKAWSSFARGLKIHAHHLKHWHHRINMSRRLKKEINLTIKQYWCMSKEVNV